MRKFVSAILAAVLVSVLCGSAFAADSAVTLRFNNLGVATDAHTKGMELFAKKAAEYSNGSIKVKTYHSGSLYTQEGETEAILNGELDMCYISWPTIATKAPELSMFTAGYFFSSYGHMTKALNGKFARTEIYPRVTKAMGVVPLGAFYLGSRQINTRSKPVYKPEDLKGVLLRMPGLPAWLFLGRALGANPTPMAFGEVYTGLSTGAIDGQDNPMPTVKNAKFYEVAKYLALTYHVIDSMTICAAGSTWEKLSDAQKTAVQRAADDARAFIDETNLKAEAELVAFFKAHGVTVTEPDIKAFKDQVTAAYLNDKDMSGKWDMELYKKVQDVK